MRKPKILKPVTVATIARRIARMDDIKGFAAVIMTDEGAITVWHTVRSTEKSMYARQHLLELVGGAHMLAAELAWNVPSGMKIKTFPAPRRKRKKK